MKSTSTNTTTKKSKPAVAKAALTKTKQLEAQIPTISPDLEENEDLDGEEGSAGGAPSMKDEGASHTPKNFRNHPDMENFFRFIYENDLRVEALHILDEIILNQNAKRNKK